MNVGQLNRCIHHYVVVGSLDVITRGKIDGTRNRGRCGGRNIRPFGGRRTGRTKDKYVLHEESVFRHDRHRTEIVRHRHRYITGVVGVCVSSDGSGVSWEISRIADSRSRGIQQGNGLRFGNVYENVGPVGETVADIGVIRGVSVEDVGSIHDDHRVSVQALLAYRRRGVWVFGGGKSQVLLPAPLCGIILKRPNEAFTTVILGHPVAD